MLDDCQCRQTTLDTMAERLSAKHTEHKPLSNLQVAAGQDTHLNTSQRPHRFFCFPLPDVHDSVNSISLQGAANIEQEQEKAIIRLAQMAWCATLKLRAATPLPERSWAGTLLATS